MEFSDDRQGFDERGIWQADDDARVFFIKIVLRVGVGGEVDGAVGSDYLVVEHEAIGDDRDGFASEVIESVESIDRLAEIFEGGV